MATVGIREFRDKLTRYVGRVRRGGRIVITDRGSPVAILVPYREGGEPGRRERLASLLSSAHVSAAERSFVDRPPAARGRGRLASALIVEDRR